MNGNRIRFWYSDICQFLQCDYSGSEHSLDGVSGDGIEEEKDEEGEEEDDDHLDDGPLVVVPDDVPDGLQWI